MANLRVPARFQFEPRPLGCEEMTFVDVRRPATSLWVSRSRAPRHVARLLSAIVCLAVFPATAQAQLAVHVEGTAARMVGSPKSEQFGWGSTGLVAPELRFGERVGIELPIGFIA